jgi:hypothetical protein
MNPVLRERAGPEAQQDEEAERKGQLREIEKENGAIHKHVDSVAETKTKLKSSPNLAGIKT